MTAGRRLIVALMALIAITGCAAAPVGVSSAGAAPEPTPSPPAWHLATLPETKATSVLWDVAAADATHAWAVGSEAYSPTEQYTTGVPVVLGWNGSQWSPTALPTITWNGSFRLVAAGSATDVWVVGGPTSHDIDDNVTVVLHYDGNAWQEVPFPAGSTPSIMSITGLSVVDGHAWLVGHRNSAAVILEWTGQAWQEHQPPAECTRGGWMTFCNVTAIKAFAANDIWAAGNGMWTGFMGPLLFHWDGTAWKAVQVGINQQPLAFKAIDGRSSTDMWAVGDTLGQGGSTLAAHGDGTTWQTVGGLPARFLPGIAVDTAGTPWLIGNSTAPGATLSTYRSPGPWVDTPAPTPPNTVGMTLHAITAITAIPGTERVLAVGAADLPTSPRLLQRVVLEYGSTQ